MDGEDVPTVAGPSVKVKIDGSTVMINDATVTTADIVARRCHPRDRQSSPAAEVDHRSSPARSAPLGAGGVRCGMGPGLSTSIVGTVDACPMTWARSTNAASWSNHLPTAAILRCVRHTTGTARWCTRSAVALSGTTMQSNSRRTSSWPRGVRSGRTIRPWWTRRLADGDCTQQGDRPPAPTGSPAADRSAMCADGPEVPRRRPTMST